MNTQQEVLTTSVKAPVDLSKNLFVDFDGSIPLAGTKTLGVVQADTAAGNQAPIMAEGIAIVLSGSVVNAKDKITTDAEGKAVPVVDTQAVNGYALDTASGADQLIRVHLK